MVLYIILMICVMLDIMFFRDTELVGVLQNTIYIKV